MSANRPHTPWNIVGALTIAALLTTSAVMAVGASSMTAAAAAPSTSTITFTVGNDVTWTVPAWTTKVHVEAAGGGGSRGQSTSTSSGGYGAPGSIVSADITVTPG